MTESGAPGSEVTLEQWESALDFLAIAIEKSGSEAELYFPLWNRVEKEIQILREKKDIRSAVRDRIKRFAHQKAA